MITILSKQDAGVPKNLTDQSSPILTDKKILIKNILVLPIEYIGIYGYISKQWNAQLSSSVTP